MKITIYGWSTSGVEALCWTIVPNHHNLVYPMIGNALYGCYEVYYRFSRVLVSHEPRHP
jgi:hypothetical protein